MEDVDSEDEDDQDLQEVKEVLDIFENIFGKELLEKYSLAQLLGDDDEDNDDWENLDVLRLLIQMRMNVMG
jgi:hypothetical protein